MRKIYFIILLLVAAVTMNGQKVFTEYFQDATPGSNLEDYNDWYVSFKEDDAKGVSPLIDEEMLYYENYPGSDTGYSVLLDSLVGVTNDTKRISTRVVAPIDDGDTLRPIIGEKMYAAFIVTIGPYSKNSWRDFFMWEGSTGSNWSRGRVFAKPVNERQDLQFAVSKNSSSSGDLDLAATEVLVGELDVPHLLVLVYEAIEGDANDKIHLYVNPDPTKPEAEQAAPITNVDNNSDYSEGTEIKINVRQRAVGAKVGGIRVGRTWEAVVMGQEEDPGTSVSQVNASNNGIRAYRNEIITSGAGNIQVFDVSGRNVLNHITSGRIATSLKSGIYIVRFEDNNGKVVTGKIRMNAE